MAIDFRKFNIFTETCTIIIYCIEFGFRLIIFNQIHRWFKIHGLYIVKNCLVLKSKNEHC